MEGGSRGISRVQGVGTVRVRMGRIVAAEVLVASLALLLGVFVVAPSASATDPIQDLGTLPGDESSRATAINDAGQIVGISGTCSDPTHAFLWADGVMTDLGSLPGTVRTYPSDINNAGQIVGTGRDASWNPYAFLWEDGVMTALGNFSAASINDVGQIVGWVWTSSGSHPALWENNTLTDLGTPDPTRVYGEANDINNAGQIVGETFTEDHDGIGFLWDTGTWTDLGTLPNDSASWAYAINDAGQIAGSSGSRYEGETSGFRWESGVMTDLGNLGGPQDPYTKAAGMNAAGEVVGSSDYLMQGYPYASVHGFRWTEGAMKDLGDLGFWFSVATDINGAGLVVGYSSTEAVSQGCSRVHAVLWTGGAVVHDVAVVAASAHPRSVVVGTIVSIDAMIENLGTQRESFDVQATAGVYSVGTLSLTLDAQTFANVTFSWDTSRMPLGSYATAVAASGLGSDANRSNDQMGAGIVSIYPPATASASATPSATDVGRTVSFLCVASHGVPPLGVSWDFGDGAGGSGARVSHAYASPGEKTATCTVTDGGGNTVSDATTVQVYPVPSVIAAVDHPTAEPGDLLTFSATAAGGSGDFTFNWGFGDNSSAQGATVQHAYATEAQYTAIVTVYDSAGGAASNTVTVSVSAPLPSIRATASALPASTDVGLSITFTCGVSDGTPPYTFSWTFGDEATGSESTMAHAYTSSGPKTATCTITDAAGQTASSSVTIQVYPVPAVAASVDRPNASPGTTLTFTANATGGSGTFTYSWGFGDGFSAQGDVVTHVYEAPGQYTAVVTVQDSAGGTAPNTVALTVTVSYVTAMATQSTVTSLAGDEITFSAVASGGAGAPYVFTWEFGDGQSDTGATVTYAYPTAGTYTPTVTVTDASGVSQTKTLTVVVVRNPPPTTLPSGGSPDYTNFAVGGIVVVAAGVIVALYALRRRPPKT